MKTFIVILIVMFVFLMIRCIKNVTPPINDRERTAETLMDLASEHPNQTERTLRPSLNEYFIAYRWNGTYWTLFNESDNAAPYAVIYSISFYMLDGLYFYEEFFIDGERIVDIWQRRTEAIEPIYKLYKTPQHSYHITGGTQLAKAEPIMTKEEEGIITLVPTSELSNFKWYINDVWKSDYEFINLWYPYAGQTVFGIFYDTTLPEYAFQWTPLRTVNVIKTELRADYNDITYFVHICEEIRYTSQSSGNVTILPGNESYSGCSTVNEWTHGIIE